MLELGSVLWILIVGFIAHYINCIHTYIHIYIYTHIYAVQLSNMAMGLQMGIQLVKSSKYIANFPTICDCQRVYTYIYIYGNLFNG